jgi:hypothetical protein
MEDSREGPDRGSWQFLRERSGTVAMVAAGGVILTGALLMVYAAGGHNHHAFANGEDTIILAVYTFLAGAAGYGLKAWKKRTRSERKLDEAREALEDAVGHVERLTNGPTVTRLHSR